MTDLNGVPQSFISSISANALKIMPKEILENLTDSQLNNLNIDQLTSIKNSLNSPLSTIFETKIDTLVNGVKLIVQADAATTTSTTTTTTSTTTISIITNITLSLTIGYDTDYENNDNSKTLKIKSIIKQYVI